MATLRFSFGTMGSGKSTLALQIHHNLSTRGLRGLLLTKLDRDGSQVTSRLGVSSPAVCWCGARATNNARLVNDQVVFEGETVMVGDTSTTRKEPLFGDVVRYELLCRYHYRRGQLTPNL
jgi:thymidine kinase